MIIQTINERFLNYSFTNLIVQERLKNCLWNLFWKLSLTLADLIFYWTKKFNERTVLLNEDFTERTILLKNRSFKNMNEDSETN